MDCWLAMIIDTTQALQEDQAQSTNSGNKAKNSSRSSILSMSRPTDEENWIPSRTPKLATARTIYSSSPRKSRMLATGSMVLAVMVLGSWHWYIGELPCMGHFWKNTGDGMLDNQS
jgi:hypothetical protein